MFVNVARFVALKSLSGSERQKLEVCSAIMSRLWQAGADTGIFSLEEVRERGRCLLVANAMLAGLHHLGHRDASVLRCGATRTTFASGGQGECITTGHPAVPRDTPLWNAHMVVQWGKHIFDPTFHQFQVGNEPLVHAAVFESQPRFRFRLHGHGKVDGFARAGWWTGIRHSAFVLFHLPMSVDRATRNWRGRPDARPELRQALLERMIELLDEQAASGRG